MSADPATIVAETRRLLRLIALEMAFVDPHGRSPAVELHRLVAELGRVLVGHAPDGLVSLVDEARGIVESAPGVAATLPSDALARLHDWQSRIEEAVIQWSRGPSVPDVVHAAVVPAAPSAVAEDFAVLPGDADPELVALFCSESQDLLQEVEQSVLVLEERPDDSETLATVFRAFHTFKGNASVMKLAVLQRLAHELESLLDAARRGVRRLDRPAIDAILAGADIFRRFVAEMAAQADGRDVGRRISLPVAAVVEHVHGLLAVRSGGVEPPRAAHKAVVEQSGSSIAAEPVADASPAPPAAAAPPPAEAAAVRSTAGAAAGMVRVDTAKLDGLIDLVGELVIAQSLVAENPNLAAGGEALARDLGRLRGISSELQRTALSLRMVPVRGAFQKMARLVRDLSGHLGKEIRLVLEGEETELDRTLVEELADPLVHMIRNAADHGIESPAERVAGGKEPFGTIRLRAFHKGGMIVIEIGDDGRGLSVSRIRAKAEERGLIGPRDQLSDREVLDQIFAPGFSLAARITDLSGRGVGMDVVRRNIERLRGTIEIESIEGRGTTFTIALPLTLAIIEGLLVQVGAERFVVPTLSVRESFRPGPQMISSVQGRGEVVSVRGVLAPLVRLADRLGIPDAVTDPTHGIVMVLEAGADSRCVLVDALVGKQEVVIKSLGDTFCDHPAFAGAAILGDGRVGLILDATALVRLKPPHAEAA